MVKKKAAATKAKPVKKVTAKKKISKAKAKKTLKAAAEEPEEKVTEPVQAAPAPVVAEVVDLPVEEVVAERPQVVKPAKKEIQPETTTLSISLTGALLNKLRRSAGDEGVALETLVHELLAEGATLRAFEIVERKNAMRQPAQKQQGNGYQNGGQNRNGNGNGNRRNNHRRGGNGGNGNGNGNGGNNWMEDKAQFLEYVRNQEKRRR